MARGGKKKKKGGNAKKKAAERKANDKKRVKLVEDKTFGLKNKNKSKKVQRNIAIIKQNAQQAGRTRGELRAEKEKKEARKRAKEEKRRKEREEAALGIAPLKKSDKVCPFFLAGKCRRGKKCKMRHTKEPQKALSVYEDPRDQTMENWTQEELEAAVNKKQRAHVTTDIICQYFLEAIATKKYGHFWRCVNGPKCIYRHKLPPGYVLKQDKKVDDSAEEVDIGEQIEEERRKLNLLECTPLTHEVFLKWKAECKAKKDAELEAERQKAAKKKGNKGQHILSGRALFEFDPTLFQDDEDAEVDLEIKETGSDEDEEADTGNEAQSHHNLFEPYQRPAETPAAAAPAADAATTTAEAKETEGTTTTTKTKTKTKGKRKKRKGKKKKGAKKSATKAADKAVPVDASLFMDDEDLPDFDD